ALIGSGAPRRGFRGAEAFIEKAVLDQFSPDMAGAVVVCRAVDTRRMIGDGDSHGSDPLRYFGLLGVAIRRQRDFGQLLAKAGRCQERQGTSCEHGFHGSSSFANKSEVGDGGLSRAVRPRRGAKSKRASANLVSKNRVPNWLY